MNRWFIHFGNLSEWMDKTFVLVILMWKCIPNFCEWGAALCVCHMLPSLLPLFLECLAALNVVGETTVVAAQWMLLLDFCRNMFCCCLVAKSCLTLLWPPRTVPHQVPLSMGFPRQEYWSGLPFPSPGDPPNSGIEPASPALAGRFFTTEPPGKSYVLPLSWAS